MNRIKMLVTSVIITFTLALTGCVEGERYNPNNAELYPDMAGGYFEVINKWNSDIGMCRIVYAKDTGVKYLMIRSGYQLGITPLYNADGSLQVYEEE